MVTAGSAIRAGLLTAVNSDLPELAEAQVTESVCDIVTGRYLLIRQTYTTGSSCGYCRSGHPAAHESLGARRERWLHHPKQTA